MTLVLIISFFICLILSVPIVVSLGIASIIALFYGNMANMDIILQIMFSSINSFTLIAVPFFILAGAIMEYGGISQRIIDVGYKLVGHFNGGLGLVVIITSLFFAGISGSGVADAAAIGGILIPSMIRRNYSKSYAAALTASSGMTGVVMPPSITMIIYGVAAGVSIGALFMAGILPAFLIGVGLIITNYIISKKRGYKGLPQKSTLKEVMISLKRALLALVLPFIIMGGIRFGFFTPTEAASMAVLYSLVIGLFVYKEIKFRDLSNIMMRAILLSGSTIIIVTTASLFGWILAFENIPTIVAEFMTNSVTEPWVLLLLINIFLLFVGMFMDSVSALFILTPLLVPIAVGIGVDPIHFGVIVIVNLAIGLVTPPVGLNLFVTSSISGSSISEVAKDTLPFLLMFIIVLMLITYIPEISLFLPELFGMM